MKTFHKYVLDVAYNGAGFHGWQIQQNAMSVQQTLNQALQTLLQLEIETFGSGRTDTGVHALQQYVQIENDIEILDPQKFIFKLNAILPHEIAVKHIFKADSKFSVRFDALFRKYEYRIAFDKNPFLQKQVLFLFNRTLDIELMNKAAQILFQHTDFQCFSKYHTEVSHYICHIYEAEWRMEGSLLVFHIKANRFLRGMVRAIVGTLLRVGKHEIDLAGFEQIILSKDRKNAGFSVAANGLFLTEVGYKEGDLIKLA